MSNEGYLQIKIRELNEEVEKIEQRVNILSEQIDKNVERLLKAKDEMMKDQEPMLKARDAVEEVKEEMFKISKFVAKEEVDKGMNELRFLVNNFDKEQKEIIHKIGNGINKELESIEQKRDISFRTFIHFLNETLNLKLVMGSLPNNFNKKDIINAKKKYEEKIKKELGRNFTSAEVVE